MKKYFIPVLLLSILAIGGCSVSKNVNTNSQNTNQPQDQKSNRTPEKITNENFSQGGLTDLEIGKRALVMGKKILTARLSRTRLLSQTAMLTLANLDRTKINNPEIMWVKKMRETTINSQAEERIAKILDNFRI